VKIEYRTTGGVAHFPGLAAPFVIDTADLPPDRRATIERLVKEARFFDQPADALPPRGADYQIGTLTIRDGDAAHTVQRADPITDPALAALFDAVRKLRMEVLQAKRTGKTDSGDK
jgi:hypothetical protein